MQLTFLHNQLSEYGVTILMLAIELWLHSDKFYRNMGFTVSQSQNTTTNILQEQDQQATKGRKE
jgi:hypothetical protein